MAIQNTQYLANFIAIMAHQHWHLYGKLHRKDGPASIYADGTKIWIQYGKIHREDGPAIVNSNDSTAYYLCGVKYKLFDYLEIIK
jgi:hypothetical protein